MKKILITFLAFAFALTSCEFDKGFEEMNVNPNAAAQIGVGNKFAKTILIQVVVDTKTGEIV